MVVVVVLLFFITFIDIFLFVCTVCTVVENK